MPLSGKVLRVEMCKHKRWKALGAAVLLVVCLSLGYFL